MHVLWPVCLHPHNFISNVVVSLTIHDDKYIFFYIRDAAKNMKQLWKVKGSFNRTSWKVSDVQIVRCSWVLSVSLCLCLCLCVLCVVCCFVVVVEEGRGRRTGETNRTIWVQIPAKVSLKRAETDQLYQVKRMIGGIGDMLFSICSQTGNVYDPTVSLVNPFGTK